MTVRVTPLHGADAGAYYVDKLPAYYVDPSEPAGVWHGRAAGPLGLGGTVADGDFLRLMAGVHPTHMPRHEMGRPYGEKSVRGFDVTASAPKSVSVLWAVGDPYIQAEVVGAHDAAVAATVGWIEDHAHTRRRINGQVAVVDARGIVAAAFRQHTSRALDPQLHTHVVVANRVRSDDGRWLALDARTIMLDQRTLSALYHSTLRSELTRRLGVEWGPVENGIAEITGVPQRVLDEFSQRSGDVARRLEEKLDRLEATLGREATVRERWRLEREAVVDSRPGKAHGVDAAQLREGWAARLHTHRLTGPDLTDLVIGRHDARTIDSIRTNADSYVRRAVGALEQQQSSWRPAEITRELAALLPPVEAAPGEIVGLLEQLTTRAVATCCVDLSRPVPEGALLRRDGRPVSESVAERVLTTEGILAEERALLAWADRRAEHPGHPNLAATERSVRDLTGPQAETAAAVAGTADLVLVVGPAGTGKTAALAPAVAELHAQRRGVFGVAPSAAAAKVLQAETGVAADTVDKFLAEHDRADGPRRPYWLNVGGTLIVDETAMIPTGRLAALTRLADQEGWRVVMLGDPLQFAPVGRGGMYQLLVDTHGAITLDRVHRFTQPWEAEASLRLRQGDPTVAVVYDAHGRIHGGTHPARDALNAWHTARREGATVVLSASTTETVVDLNHAAQQLRARHGDLNLRSPSVAASPYRLHVGDEIVTRENDRRLTTDRGEMIRNRDTFTITALHRDGAVTATGRTGTVKLPGWYVAEHVELGYAQTSHITQGRTVDRSILVLDSATDLRGLYVPLTRGRDANDVYITTSGNRTAVDVFVESIGRSHIDIPAHARAAQVNPPERHRPGLLDPHQIRDLYDQQATLTDTLNHLDREFEGLPGDRAWHTQHLAKLTEQRLGETAVLQEAFDTIKRYDKPLIRGRHEHDLADARRTADTFAGHATATTREIDRYTADLTDIERRLDTARRQQPHMPAMQARLDTITQRLDHDANQRLQLIRRDPDHNITAQLGQRPPGQAGRLWDHAAGLLDQHHAAWPDRQVSSPGRRLADDLAHDATRQFQRAIQPPERHRQREREGPDLGISM